MRKQMIIMKETNDERLRTKLESLIDRIKKKVHD